jgi:hypothetical protein
MRICAARMLAVGDWPATSHARWAPPDIGLWTKVKQNAEARRLGYTKRCGKRPGQSAPLRLNDAHLQPGARLFAAHQTGGESADAGGAHPCPRPRLDSPCGLLQAGARLGGAKLWYDRSKQRFYLLVWLAIDTPDPTPARKPQIVGIAVGQRYLATVATLGNRAQFSSGKETRAKADHYARLQKRLEPKRHVAAHAPQNRAGPGRRDGPS